MKVVLLLIASILLQETTAELVLTTCARMNDGILSKVAQGLCISSCRFQVITSFFLYRICQKNANEWHFDNYFKIVSSSQNSWSLYVHTITCETSNTSLYFSEHLLFQYSRTAEPAAVNLEAVGQYACVIDVVQAAGNGHQFPLKQGRKIKRKIK